MRPAALCTGQAGVSVTGTTITLTASPPTALSATTAVEISASVVDAAKVAARWCRGQFRTTGGTLSSAVATTDAAGLAKVTSDRRDGGRHGDRHRCKCHGDRSVKAGSTALPPTEPAGIAIKDLTIQANPSVVGPNAAGAETNYSQLDVRVTGDLGAALGIPVANAPRAVPDRFVAAVW